MDSWTKCTFQFHLGGFSLDVFKSLWKKKDKEKYYNTCFGEHMVSTDTYLHKLIQVFYSLPWIGNVHHFQTLSCLSPSNTSDREPVQSAFPVSSKTRDYMLQTYKGIQKYLANVSLKQTFLTIKILTKADTQ